MTPMPTARQSASTWRKRPSCSTPERDRAATQYSVGSGAFGAARELGRDGAAVADARDDRRFSGRRLDRDRDEALEFVETERKEFPGSSGGEQSGRAMTE